MDDDDIVVTNAMRRAVNREACNLQGHSLFIIYTAFQPSALLCDRCSEEWKVVPGDA
jgi:hypothetical protein